MKSSFPIRYARSRTGFMILECLVYMAVFTVIVGLGLATFYFYWDTSRGLRETTDDISAALRAGERWRADIRHATGKIVVEQTAVGECLHIPRGTNEILYEFTADEILRESGASGFAGRILTSVKASHMTTDDRGPVGAWRWELELKPYRKATHWPLQFTFEAAISTPP